MSRHVCIESCWFLTFSLSLFLSRSSDAAGSEVKDREAQRVNVGSCFLTSRRRRSLSLRAWVRAAWASESWDSRVCLCNSRIIGLVSASYSSCTLWQGAARQVGGYQILPDSNRCNYNTITQSCVLTHLCVVYLRADQEQDTSVTAVFKTHRALQI